MSMYTTTAVPSLDALGGLETISRLLQPHTEIIEAAWDAKSGNTVAVLETRGPIGCLKAVAEIINQFKLPLYQSSSFNDIHLKAQEFAHEAELVEITNFRLEDTFSL